MEQIERNPVRHTGDHPEGDKSKRTSTFGVCCRLLCRFANGPCQPRDREVTQQPSGKRFD